MARLPQTQLFLRPTFCACAGSLLSLAWAGPSAHTSLDAAAPVWPDDAAAKRRNSITKQKEQRSHSERVEDLFEQPLFNKVKSMYPDCLKKVKAVQGDITHDQLGISNEDWQELCANVTVRHVGRLGASTQTALLFHHSMHTSSGL